eukprot:5102846-Prymnesium_polylepis.1
MLLIRRGAFGRRAAVDLAEALQHLLHPTTTRYPSSPASAHPHRACSATPAGLRYPRVQKAVKAIADAPAHLASGVAAEQAPAPMR